MIDFVKITDASKGKIIVGFYNLKDEQQRLEYEEIINNDNVVILDKKEVASAKGDYIIKLEFTLKNTGGIL